VSTLGAAIKRTTRGDIMNNTEFVEGLYDTLTEGATLLDLSLPSDEEFWACHSSSDTLTVERQDKATGRVKAVYTIHVSSYEVDGEWDE